MESTDESWAERPLRLGLRVALPIVAGFVISACSAKSTGRQDAAEAKAIEIAVRYEVGAGHNAEHFRFDAVCIGNICSVRVVDLNERRRCRTTCDENGNCSGTTGGCGESSLTIDTETKKILGSLAFQ